MKIRKTHKSFKKQSIPGITGVPRAGLEPARRITYEGF
jgi:hypothetical protein